jgi:hypothetical protein
MKTYNLELTETGFNTLFVMRETGLTESDKNTLKRRFELISDKGNKQGDAVIYADDYVGVFIGAGKEVRSPKTYKLTEREGSEFLQTWSETKAAMQKNGSQFFNLEKSRNGYKNGVVTYQNILCEYWTAMLSDGLLTDIMIKAKSMEEARENHYRWQQYLD